MSELAFVIGIKQFAEPELHNDITWVKAAPWDRWDHPIYGETVFTRDRGERMKEHFYSDTRGHEIATDYEHGLDKAKGEKASGWIKEVDARDDGLWLGVNFTELAKQEIANGEWKYFSYQFQDEWEHPHTNKKYQDVLVGGGLTNKPWIKGNPPINFSELYTEVDVEDDKPKGEVADKEHSEPGSGGGGEPEPRKDDPPSKDHEPGTREDSPPVEPEAKVKDDLDAKLRKELGLSEDADILKAVTEMNAEVAPIREAAKAMSEKKSFAESYPAEFKEMERLREQDKKREARSFSEQYAKFKSDDGKETGFGFSALVLEKLEDTHKKFSEGIGTVSDFSEILDLVANGKGIVQYSEAGSTIFTETEDEDNETSTDVATKKASRRFAEKVAEMERDDNLDYRSAVKAAAESNPELFKAYRAEMEGGVR